MKLLSYFRDHWKIMLLLAVCLGAYTVVLCLYRTDGEALEYGLLVAGLVILIGFLVDFLRYRRRFDSLKQARAQLPYELNLPAPAGRKEREYQQLLQTLFEQYRQLDNAGQTTRRETQDYYSLWVHQIKVPIAAMDLLLQTHPGPDTPALQGELFKVRRYVEMVLSYLRLESSTTDYLIRRYDLDKIIRQGVRKFASLFILSQVKLEFTPTNLSVLTDEKWLGFAMEQLLSNAVKYTKPGGTVKIYAKPEQVLVVEDTGIGIAPEDLPRIWDKGFTGLNGRMEQKSTGLGLYLCRRVLSNLGHSIQIFSQPRKGTRVEVELKQKELWVAQE